MEDYKEKIRKAASQALESIPEDYGGFGAAVIYASLSRILAYTANDFDEAGDIARKALDILLDYAPDTPQHAVWWSFLVRELRSFIYPFGS